MSKNVIKVICKHRVHIYDLVFSGDNFTMWCYPADNCNQCNKEFKEAWRKMSEKNVEILDYVDCLKFYIKSKYPDRVLLVIYNNFEKNFNFAERVNEMLEELKAGGLTMGEEGQALVSDVLIFKFSANNINKLKEFVMKQENRTQDNHGMRTATPFICVYVNGEMKYNN